MVVRCCVASCKRKFRKGSGISLHEFPSDPKLRQEWIKAVYYEGFTLYIESYKVCSDHFKQTDFKQTDAKQRFLKKGTVPSIFSTDSENLPPNKESSSVRQKQNDVQGDSDTQESKSILPNDGPGWGSSSDNTSTRAVTIKTEPPEYVEQDEEPSSHLVSVKSEPECYEDVREPNSLVPDLKKDYTDVTKVTFHFNAEPQISEETQRQHSAAVAVKIEPPDPTEVRTEAVSMGTEPTDYVEQDEGPSSHLVSVKSEPECYDEVQKPHSLVPTFTKGYTDMTKVSFHFNAEPQVSEETRRQHNTAVAVKIEPPDPTEVHSKAVSTGTACAAPSFALLPLPHPAVPQSSASQGDPRGALPPLLPAPRKMTVPETFISVAAATSPVAKRRRGPPRQYTAEERRERRNAAKRAKRLAAKSTIVGKSPKTRCKSPNTRRAERTAAQRARRQNEAIRKRERGVDRKAKLSKWEKASISLLAATAAEAKHVQGDSDTQESESILPDDGPGWGSSSDNSLTQAVTIKTESPEYDEQDEEPSSLVPAFTKEPQVSEEARRRHNTAVAVKIEPPDPTEVHTEAVSTGTGLDGSSGNTAMTAVTIKTEPEWYEEVWEPGNPVPALTKGEPPDYTDVTKVMFHVNPEPQVSKGAQQLGNAAVAVKIEPRDPTEVDAPASSPGAVHPRCPNTLGEPCSRIGHKHCATHLGLGAGAPTEFQQDLVPTNPIGSYAVAARPLQWVPTSVRDEAQPQANIIYFHNVERHGIATQPVVVTLPVVAVQPELPDVAPPWLVGLGPGAASSQEVGPHRVLVVPTVAVRPP